MPSHSEVIEMIIAQRDEAQEAAETYHEAWQDAAVYWKDDRDRLRTALKRYGLHDVECGWVQHSWDCTCGLDALLAEKEAGSSADPASET